MTRKKTSKKQAFSLESMIKTTIKSKKVTELNPEAAFLNSQKVGSALLDCLIDNDPETFIEILDSYLRVNKLQVAKKAKMSRSTVQQALTNGNPTLKTLAKIVHVAYAKNK